MAEDEKLPPEEEAAWVEAPIPSDEVADVADVTDVADVAPESNVEQVGRQLVDEFHREVSPVSVVPTGEVHESSGGGGGDVDPSNPLEPEDSMLKLYFLFDAIQSEPKMEKIFLSSGGAISAAASRGSTDFAITGSTNSVVTELSDKYASTVKIEINPNHFSFAEDMTIEINNRSKLLACTSRSGAAINGSIVNTISGQGASYLSSLLRTGTSAASMPLTYSSWMAHSAVLSLSNFRIVDGEDRHYTVRFTKDAEKDEILKVSEDYISAWADGAWKMRQNVLVYPYSPSLTKCVAKVPVGTNDSGYSLVHDVAHPVSKEFSYTTIESLLKQGINTDLEFVTDDVEAFLEDTKSPGLKAAQKGGRTVAAAMSLIANLLVSYRADGRTSVMPTGSVAVAAESWLRQAARKRGKEGNDCDGSAILINNILDAVKSSTESTRSEFQFINAVYNVIHPHYMIGISVLGASSAEASGGGEQKTEGKPKKVAGHAVTLMLPTMGIMLGLERGGRQTVEGKPILEEDNQNEIAAARFNAIYTPEVVEAMPDGEKPMFASWEDAKNHINAHPVEPFAMEGTTPASPILFRRGDQAEAARRTLKRDDRAFEAIGANIGRSIKLLYAGGKQGEDLHHMFYDRFVEVTFPRSTPFWKDPKLRELGAAFSQFVFSKHDGETRSLPIQMAGTTPEELVEYKYAVVPLVVADEKTAGVLDYASEVADADVMPPRREEDHTLSKFETKQLTTSLSHLEELNHKLRAKMVNLSEQETTGHTVAYMLSFSTLVNNPMAVKHMCDRLSDVAISGVVDSVEIDRLVTDSEGRDAGRMVILNAIVSDDSD